jgi:murein L,D-transpeptidase YcbB/YkuD
MPSSTCTKKAVTFFSRPILLDTARIAATGIAIGLALASCSGKTTRSPGDTDPPSTKETATLLQQRLMNAGSSFSQNIAQNKIRARYGIIRFYQQTLYQPVWMTDEGALPRVQALLKTIRASTAEGLTPENFHLSTIELLLEDLKRRKSLQITLDPKRLLDLELLLTDSFLTLCNQFQTGLVAPRQSDYEWYIPREDVEEPVKILTEAIRSDRVSEALLEALPQSESYKALRAALADYRKIVRKGGWKLIPPGKTLRLGDRDRRVPVLRKRLVLSHDLTPAKSEDANLLDETLSAALKKFQERHGLESTGNLNRRTLSALNVSAPKRVRQILANMERWRWLPRNFGERHLEVNIADFRLKAVDQEKAMLEMPVIVGNLYKQTPVFTGNMTHVILNPYWHVPKNIVFETLLPKILKNPQYLEKHHFSVLRKKTDGQWQTVDPTEIDWTHVDEKTFDLTIRQDPGPSNPLGQVKFIFPNRFSIYLHDTPEKDLFKKGVRTLSSGCIRVAQPLELLEFVLKQNAPNESPWDLSRITAELDKHRANGKESKPNGTGNDLQETEIQIFNPLPVHLLYQTAWVNEAGALEFRDDIYGRDELLDTLL